MKVLSVNKFYYIKGGSETYFFSLNNMLKRDGIEVIPFSMKDDKNFKCEYSDFFVNNVEYNNMKLKEKIKNALKIPYSFESEMKIKKLIELTNPDIAHLHIFQHQITPSVIHEIKRHNIKIVNTIHDLKVICPNYKMLNNKGICEECKGGKYYNCVKNKCMKNSRLNSMVAMNEAYINKFIKSYEYVDKFICPSKFYMKKLNEFGIDKNKLVYVPNFIDESEYKYDTQEENYFLYVGRLIEEKGIDMLIEAMKNVAESTLVIVGTGPLEEEIHEKINNYNIKNIKMIGFLNKEKVRELLYKCRFVVIPSIWYENCPMAVLEAMACGKPVIGSNLGGIPELVINNINGLIFKNNSITDLADKINELNGNKDMRMQMGKMGREMIENIYNKKKHVEKIKEIYKEVLLNNN